MIDRIARCLLCGSCGGCGREPDRARRGEPPRLRRGSAGGDHRRPLSANLARALQGAGGLADRYAEGRWDSPDLVALVRLAARNAPGLDRLRRRFAPIRVPPPARPRRAEPEHAARRRADIAAHYDLGNELFSLMLDPTMTYSCAVLRAPGRDARGGAAGQARAHLPQARSRARRPPARDRHRAGAASPSMPRRRAAAASRRRRSRASSTTTRVDASRGPGSSDRVTVLLEDYRDLTGRYDKLVSIEMIEAVGWRDFGTFFARARSCSSPTARCCCRRSRSTTAPTRSRRPAHVHQHATSSRAAACRRSR